MAEFNTAYDKVRKHEGGYVNNPSDRGGETYAGITRRYYPAWPGWRLIDRKKTSGGFPESLHGNGELQTMVRALYKKEFWDQLGLDKIDSQLLADELFDTSVNMGLIPAGVILQKSLNLLNRNQQLFPDMKVDGRPGNITFRALNRIANVPLLIKVMNIFQGARYIEICERDPSQEVFFAGWIANRVSL